MIACVVAVGAVEHISERFLYGNRPQLSEQLLLAVIAAVTWVVAKFWGIQLFRDDHQVPTAYFSGKLSGLIQFALQIGF